MCKINIVPEHLWGNYGTMLIEPQAGSFLMFVQQHCSSSSKTWIFQISNKCLSQPRFKMRINLLEDHMKIIILSRARKCVLYDSHVIIFNRRYHSTATSLQLKNTPVAITWETIYSCASGHETIFVETARQNWAWLLTSPKMFPGVRPWSPVSSQTTIEC